MAPKPFAITSDSMLHEEVRAATDYADTVDELPQSRLDTLTRSAKRTVWNELERDDWYVDTGLGEMLLGVLCIKCKASVENFSVSSWDLGGTSITVADDQVESLQVKEYLDMMKRGKNAMDGDSPSVGSSHLPQQTHGFMHGWGRDRP